MAKQVTIDEQANTPVLGAEGVAEPNATATEQATATVSAPIPEWVESILDSNAAVIESNAAVLAGLESFKQHAAEFVDEIAGKAVSGAGEATPNSALKSEKEVDLTATYIVAQGKSFRDANDFSVVYCEGASVSGLDEVRLKNLLNQGIIEEA